MECSGWNCFLLEVFLQRDINMWFINHWYFILRDKFLPPFLVQHVDKVYILSLLRLELTWLNMELAQAWVDSEAGLIQMLTVTGILIATKIWKSILFLCSQILTNSWNPVMHNSENQGKFSAWFCGANSSQLFFCCLELQIWSLSPCRRGTGVYGLIFKHVGLFSCLVISA